MLCVLGVLDAADIGPLSRKGLDDLGVIRTMAPNKCVNQHCGAL